MLTFKRLSGDSGVTKLNKVHAIDVNTGEAVSELDADGVDMVVNDDSLQWISLDKYGEYFEEIRTDKHELVESRLANAGQHEKQLLLNGRFQFYDITALNLRAKGCTFTRPFLLAAAFGSVKVCDVMMKHDVSVVFAVEPGCLMNVVHCLVSVVVYDPVLEPIMVETYKHLCSRLSVEDTKRLLEMEHSGELRPLEFAMQQGTMELVGAIFDTRGVYLVREDIIDMTAYRWYNITDYEMPDKEVVNQKCDEPVNEKMQNNFPTANSVRFIANGPAVKKQSKTALVKNQRKFKSPLAMLMSLDARHLPAANRLLMSETLLRDWAEKSIRSKKISFVVSFFIRFFYLMLIYLYEMDRRWLTSLGGKSDYGDSIEGKISTDSSAQLTTESRQITTPFPFIFCDQYTVIQMDTTVLLIIAAYLMCHSLVNLLQPFMTIYAYATSSTIRVCHLFDLKGRKNRITTRAKIIDQGSDWICGLCVFVEVICLPLAKSRTDYMLFAINTQRMCITICSLWSLMVYLQILPVVGHVVIFVREMTADLFAFVLLLMFFNAIFARILILFFNVNSNQGCIQEFSTFTSAIYTLCLTMLNMKDYRVYDVYDVNMICWNHITYVLIVVMLVMNLLIAVFSNTMARVNENKAAIICLNRLCVLHEQYLSISNTPIVNRVAKNAYKRILKRNYVCEDGNVYLVCARQIEQPAASI